MKKILFYIHSLNKGGAERVLLTIAKKLNSDKDTEIVILTDRTDELEYDMPIGLRRINLENRMTRVSAVARLKEIRKCVKEEKPDKFVAFMLSSAIRAIIATLLTGYKTIAAVRSNPYDDYGKGKNRVILLTTMFFAERIVCQTEYQKEFFPDSLKKKCVIISNPIFDEFVVKSEELCERKKDVYNSEYPVKQIVATGRLYDYKNHKLLIDAFAQISDKYTDTEVVIWGEGPYREELEKEIEKLNLTNRVKLPGDSEHVAEDIADAFIYVLPSDTEGLPNALMEAMALGLPVIATDCPCGGPKSLIEDGVNGLLTPVNDVEAMKKCLERLITDRDLRQKISKNAKGILSSNDSETIIELWRQIL